MHMMREYSPGVATGLLLYIPYNAYLAYCLMQAPYGISFWLVMVLYLIGCFGHIWLIMGPPCNKTPNAWPILMKKAGYYRIPDYYPPHEQKVKYEVSPEFEKSCYE